MPSHSIFLESWTYANLGKHWDKKNETFLPFVQTIIQIAICKKIEIEGSVPKLLVVGCFLVRFCDVRHQQKQVLQLRSLGTCNDIKGGIRLYQVTSEIIWFWLVDWGLPVDCNFSIMNRLKQLCSFASLCTYQLVHRTSVARCILTFRRGTGAKEVSSDLVDHPRKIFEAADFAVAWGNVGETPTGLCFGGFKCCNYFYIDLICIWYIYIFMYTYLYYAYLYIDKI